MTESFSLDCRMRLPPQTTLRLVAVQPVSGIDQSVIILSKAPACGELSPFDDRRKP